MSEISTQGRSENADTQSVQSANLQNTSSNIQSQQRSSSQVERSERSDRSGGRNDRPRIQRSSSSTSSSSSGDERFPGAGRPQVVSGTTNTAGHQYSSLDAAYGQIGTGGRPPVGPTVVGGTGSQYHTTDATQAQAASVGSMGSVVSGERRAGRHRREVIRLPDQAQGQVRQVRRRLPTPEPDILERVYLQRTGGEVVEEITEIPTTPPPRVEERTVVEPAGPPQVIKRVIRVPPRGVYGNYQQQSQVQQQQQQQPQQPQPQGAFPFSSASSASGSYGNIQQAASALQHDSNPSASFQNFGVGVTGVPSSGASYASGYGQATPSYGAAATGYQPAPQGFGYGAAAAGGYPSQNVSPPLGCHPAFCFYV